MTDYIEKKCPKCGQRLRIPKKVGGILMICPTCNEKIHSDFRIAGGKGKIRLSIQEKNKALVSIFELPTTIIDHIIGWFKGKK